MIESSYTLVVPDPEVETDGMILSREVLTDIEIIDHGRKRTTFTLVLDLSAHTSRILLLVTASEPRPPHQRSLIKCFDRTSVLLPSITRDITILGSST